MKLTKQVRAAVQAFKAPTKNTMGSELSREFLKRGSARPLVQDWSKVIMTDKDLYTGYPYAAINTRANKVSQLALNNLKTDADPSIITKARQAQEEVIHPYIDVIDKSKSFSNYKFWYDISTFLDLEGVYYLFVLRTVGEGESSGRIGNPLEFQLLNPYNMRRIINKETLEIGGYVEARDGMVRDFKPETIIEIRKLNPFSDEDPYAMTDAAKESQYTLKQAGDYTRHSLKNNMAAPGIISTDVLLDTQQFTNFVNRVTNQEKGVPLFGNGAGAITWDSMQIDMDKAALDKITEINRQSLMAVSGVGKTLLSIEESGTTRDTAKTQKDLFVENHIMPQLQLIIDALNQDYKIHYEQEYLKNKFTLNIDNPLGTDREAELKDISIRDESYKLYDKLVAQGYKRDLASKYAEGEITLEELGEPTEEPRPNPVLEAAKLRSGGVSEEDSQNFFKWLNANPYRDDKGRFTYGGGSSTGGGSAGSVSDDEIASQLTSPLSIDSTPNHAMDYIYQKRGFNSKPKVVDSDKFDSVKGKTVYRGMSEKAHRDQFRSGETHHIPKTPGTNGTGTYFSDQSFYAQAYSNGGMVRAKIPESAKLVDSGTAYTKASISSAGAFQKHIAFSDQAQRATGAAKVTLEGQAQGYLNASVALRDPGVWAASRGYDGLKVSFEGQSGDYVLFNRGMLTVDANDVKAAL